MRTAASATTCPRNSGPIRVAGPPPSDAARAAVRACRDSWREFPRQPRGGAASCDCACAGDAAGLSRASTEKPRFRDPSGTREAAAGSPRRWRAGSGPRKPGVAAPTIVTGVSPGLTVDPTADACAPNAPGSRSRGSRPLPRRRPASCPPARSPARVRREPGQLNAARHARDPHAPPRRRCGSARRENRLPPRHSRMPTPRR